MLKIGDREGTKLRPPRVELLELGAFARPTRRALALVHAPVIFTEPGNPGKVSDSWFPGFAAGKEISIKYWLFPLLSYLCIK